MQTVFFILPAVIFFGAYKLYDLYVATACLMVTMVALTIIEWLRTRKTNKLHLASTGLLLIFGSITLALRDPEFLQWKFTIYHWAIAVVLLWTHFYREKTGLQSFFETIGNITSPDDEEFDLSKLPAFKYRVGNLGCIAYFALVGAVNLFIAYTMSEEAWVNFKVFGIMAMNFFFMIGLMYWLFRGEFTSDEAS